jgi:hypothetical protein
MRSLAVKKRLQIESSIIEFFILIILAMTSLLYLNGCTDKVLQVAKDKASPENVEFREIKSIVSAVKDENDDISVCVSLNESGESKLYTISLSLPSLSGNTDAIEKLGLRPEECLFNKCQSVKERIFEVTFVYDETAGAAKFKVMGHMSSAMRGPVIL